MGMLGTAIGSALNLGASELQKDYESQRDVAAKKDLASYEGEIRQRMQDAQNQFTASESALNRSSVEGIHAADRTSHENIAQATNELGYYNADINLGRNIQEADFQKSMIGIHQGQLANAAAALQLQRDQFNNLIKHQDVPESVRLDVNNSMQRASFYLKEAQDMTKTPQERDTAMKLGNAATQAARERLAEFRPQAPKGPDVSGGPDRREVGGKYGDAGTPSVAPGDYTISPSAPAASQSEIDAARQALAKFNYARDANKPEFQAALSRYNELLKGSAGGMLRKVFPAEPVQ